MKKVNDNWVDERGNEWSCDCFTEKQAIKNSESLSNCYFCSNCRYCGDCRNCNYCSNCRYCSNYRNCSNCNYCSNCSNCRYCSDCRGYIYQPSIYTTGKIGSRDDNTIFYYGDTDDGKSLQVVCGCFRGNLEEFENAVMKTHAKNDEYRNQYLKEIEKVKVLFELEKE